MLKEPWHTAERWWWRTFIFLIRESQSGQADTGKSGPGKSIMKTVQTDEQIGGSNDNSQKREQFGVHMHLVFVLPGAKVMSYELSTGNVIWAEYRAVTKTKTQKQNKKPLSLKASHNNKVWGLEIRLMNNSCRSKPLHVYTRHTQTSTSVCTQQKLCSQIRTGLANLDNNPLSVTESSGQSVYTLHI